MCAFVDEAGRFITLQISADLRRLTRSRFAPSSKHTLLGVATGVRYCEVHSEGEARALWLTLAHAHARRRADEAATTQTAWFLRFDHRERFPRAVPMRARELADLSDLRAVVGPYATRQSAARAAETLTDAHDLCRHHHLLVLAPDASACAYKDMGRCPAPCDGSETMDGYRARVEDAHAWLGDCDAQRSRTQAAMQDAASAMDFERAATLRTLLERSAALDERVRDIERASWCVLLPSRGEGVVRVMRVSANALTWIGTTAQPESIGTLLDPIATPPEPFAPPDALGADALGWLGSLMLLPNELNAGRRASAVVSLPASAETLAEAARAVLDRASRRASLE